MPPNTGGSDDAHELEAVVRLLEVERPVPRAAFRGELRRHLLVRLPRQRVSRRGALALVLAYAGTGLGLLAVAAVGVAGAGPLAA